MSLFSRSREDEPQDETMVPQQSAHLYEDKRYRREYANKLSSGILTFAGTVFAVALTCISIIYKGNTGDLNGLLQYLCTLFFLFPALCSIMTYKFYLENSVRIDTISAYQFEIAKEDITWEKAKKNANLNYYYDEYNNINDGYKTFKYVYLLSLFLSFISYANTLHCFPVSKVPLENEIVVIGGAVIIMMLVLLKHKYVTVYRITRLSFIKKDPTLMFIILCVIGVIFFVCLCAIALYNVGKKKPYGVYAFIALLVLGATSLLSPRFKLEATRANLIAKHIAYKFSIVINSENRYTERDSTYYEDFVLSLLRERVLRKKNTEMLKAINIYLYELPDPEVYDPATNKFFTIYNSARVKTIKKMALLNAYDKYENAST